MSDKVSPVRSAVFAPRAQRARARTSWIGGLQRGPVRRAFDPAPADPDLPSHDAAPPRSLPPRAPDRAQERDRSLSILPPSLLAPLKTHAIDVKDLPAEEAAPPLGDTARRLAAAVAEIGALRPHLFRQAEAQMVDLAMLVARRVIARELSTDPTILLGLVKEGVQALSERDRIVVRVGRGGREDAAWHGALAEDLRAALPAADLVFDPDLDEGACVLESDVGQVDASIGARLDAILSSLGGVRSW